MVKLLSQHLPKPGFFFFFKGSFWKQRGRFGQDLAVWLPLAWEEVDPLVTPGVGQH